MDIFYIVWRIYARLWILSMGKYIDNIRRYIAYYWIYSVTNILLGNQHGLLYCTGMLTDAQYFN